MSGHEKKPLVPPLRFPEFRDAGEWESKPLKFMGSFFRGLTYSADEVSEEGLLVLRSSNIQDGTLVLDKDLVFVNKTCPDDIQLRSGDIAICMSNGSKALVGKNAEFRGNYDNDLTVGAFCSIFRPSVEFSKLIFQTPIYTKFISVAIGGGNINNLKNSDLGEFEHPVPKLQPEQQKIADCLSSLDDLIAAETQKLDTLQTYKKCLMQQLFPCEGETVPRLRFPEFRNSGEWEKVSLQLVIEIASGQVDPTKPPYCDLPHVGGDNIEAGTGNLLNLRTAKEDGVISGKYAFDEHDILYSKIRPALNKVAAPGFSGVCSADIYPIRPCGEMLRREFLVYLLRSESFVKYATKHSGRGKIPKINREDLFAYDAMLPTLAEQECIASFLSSLDKRINLQSQKLEDLQSHKIGLMQQLFPALDEVGT